MNKQTMPKLFLFFLLAIALCSVAMATPPAKVITGIGTEGLEFQYKAFDILPQNISETFYFHVFNKSTGMPLYNNTALTCNFHLYNQTGSHLVDYHGLRDFDSTYDEDIEIKVNAGNFSKRGKYQFIFQCNTSKLGGFIAHNFYVTGSGFSSEDDTKYIYVLIVIGLIAFACILMYASNILQGEHPMLTALRLLFMACAFLLCYMAIGSIGGLLVYTDSTAITNTAVQNILDSDVGDSISAAAWVIRIIGTFALILLIWWAFDRLKENKWKKTTGEAYEQERH